MRWGHHPKIWINGHEWAKRQASKAGLGFTELSNGFAARDQPQALQGICDRLGPATINVFVEVSRTIVFRSRARAVGPPPHQRCPARN